MLLKWYDPPSAAGSAACSFSTAEMEFLVRGPLGTTERPSEKPVPPTPVFSVTTPWSAGSVARSRLAKVWENPTFDSPYSGTCAGANVPGLQRPPAQNI